MHRLTCALTVVALYVAVLSSPTGAAAPAYSAVKTGDIVRLEDTRAGIVVPVITTMSNAYEMVVKGHQIIRKTFPDVAQFRERPGLNGIPLLAHAKAGGPAAVGVLEYVSTVLAKLEQKPHQ